jgi:hypothetical protein
LPGLFPNGKGTTIILLRVKSLCLFETQILLRIIGLAVLLNPSSNCLRFHINDLCFDPSPNHISSSPKPSCPAEVPLRVILGNDPKTKNPFIQLLQVPTQYRSSVLESPVEFCNVYQRNRSMTVLGIISFLEKELNLLCIATRELINILRIREKNRLDTITTSTTIGKEC